MTTPLKVATALEFARADRAWSNALHAHFGKRAADERYKCDQSHHPEHIRTLHDQVVRSRDDWYAACGIGGAA